MGKTSQIELSSDLSIAVEDGQYGKFVRLQRGRKWICMSTYAWNRVRDNIEKFGKRNFTLKLTDTKEINVVDFKNNRYVSFHQCTNRGGKIYASYINLNSSEWCKLMFSSPAIDLLLTKESFDVPDTLLPEKAPKIREPRNNCTECKDEMIAVILKDGRMKETNLSRETYKSIQESNKTVQNQLGLVCDYCGAMIYYDCHCHKYDCRDCEPESFCKKCDGLLFYSSKFSDI